MSKPTPPWYLRRHRARLILIWVIGIAVFVGLMAADRHGLLLYRGDEMRRYHGRTFPVAAVVDGATLEIDTPPTRVRLLGIEVPRLGEPYAEAAADRTRLAVIDKPVTLLLEPQLTRDRDGDLPAYVELPGGVILNERLLREGLARADDRRPHRRLERFKLLELQARRRQLGLWSPDPPP